MSKRPRKQEQFDAATEPYGLWADPDPEVVRATAAPPRDARPTLLPNFAASRRRSIRLGRRLLSDYRATRTWPADLDPHIGLAAITDALGLGLGRGKRGAALLDRLSQPGYVGLDCIGLLYVTAVWAERNMTEARQVGWAGPEDCAQVQRDLQAAYGLDVLTTAVLGTSRLLPW